MFWIIEKTIIMNYGWLLVPVLAAGFLALVWRQTGRSPWPWFIGGAVWGLAAFIGWWLEEAYIDLTLSLSFMLPLVPVYILLLAVFFVLIRFVRFRSSPKAPVWMTIVSVLLCLAGCYCVVRALTYLPGIVYSVKRLLINHLFPDAA